MMDERQQISTVRCAARKGETAESQRAMEQFVSEKDWGEPTWYAAKDEDELNQETCAGRYDVVVYPNLEALLCAVWKRDADLENWEANGVRLELAEEPHAGDWRNIVRQVSNSHARWHHKARRREIMAGVVLSVLGLAAVAALLRS